MGRALGIGVLLFVLLFRVDAASACTGISLKAGDGSVVAARTVEWGLSDAEHDRLVIVPRGWRFSATAPEGAKGKQWSGRYGFVSLSAYGQPFGPDGMNEKGLYVGMFYLPGFADYAAYDAATAAVSLSVGDFMQWMLSSFSSVDEVRANLDKVRVIHVDDKRFGGAPLPFHWKVADPSGRSIVIEVVAGGRMEVYDSFLGIVTNAPTYDWHLLNLRNYLKLSPSAPAELQLDGLTLSNFGAGAGLIGLPGDFSPPSRFIRAAALTASVRPLADASEAVDESFRILDSFNIPLGTTAPSLKLPGDIPGVTQITSASDLTNRVYYFHTMHNRRVQKLDLKRIDFSRVRMQVVDPGAGRRQDMREISIGG